MKNRKLNVECLLGKISILTKEVLRLKKGSIIDLNIGAGGPVDIYVENKNIAYGNISVYEKFLTVRIDKFYNKKYKKEIKLNEFIKPKVEEQQKKIIKNEEFENLFEFITQINPKTVAEFLKHENIQFSTIIIAYINEEHASKILNYLEPEINAEIIKRLSNFKEIDKELIQRLLSIFKEKFEMLQEDKINFSSKEKAKIIFDKLSKQNSDSIIETMNEIDSELSNYLTKS